MKHKMLLLSALLILILALTACGPAASANPTSTALAEMPTSMSTEIPTVETTSEATTTETTPSGTTTESAPSTTETAIVPVTGGETLLGVSQSDKMGPYLVDKDGMTVYVYSQDTQNGSTSACTGDCATTWPPVTMAGSVGQGTPGVGTSMPGTLGTGTPEMGTSMPGALGTDTPGTGSGTATTGSETPSSGSGYGLGTSTPEAGGTGGTGSGTSVAGTAMPGNGLDPSLIGSITRDDGTVQLTYNGWPLYRYSQDVAPGDTNGQGKGSQWSMISPAGEAINK